MVQPSDAAHRLALGHVVVAAGRVEHAAYDLAFSLGVPDPPSVSVTKALKLARRQLVSDAPPWSTLDVPSFDRWTNDVVRSLEQRNRLFHSLQTYVATPDGWVHQVSWLRDGSTVPATPENIAAVARDLERVFGHSPVRRVLLELRVGVYIRMLTTEGFNRSLVYAQGASYPARPTDAEIDTWWGALPSDTRVAWSDWAARHRR